MPKTLPPIGAEVPDEAMPLPSLPPIGGEVGLPSSRVPTDVTPATTPTWTSRLGLTAPVSAFSNTPRLMGFLKGSGTAALDLAEGVKAGAASTIFHGGDLLRRGLGMERVIERPAVQAWMTPPESVAGKIGFVGEQAAEFAVPLTKLSKATKGASILKRIGADAAASAGVASVQSGGDPDAMALAGVGGAVLPVAGAIARPVFRGVQRAAAGAQEGGVGGALAGVIRSAAPNEPRTLLVQALKPRSTATNFEGALDLAMPEIKATGTAINGIDDLLTATKAAKATIQQQLNVLRGAQREIGAEVDLSSVADAMTRSIPKKLQLESPDAALRLTKAADVYRRSFTLDEAETLLRETNAELDGFYAMYPQAQRTAATANPATAALDAQAKALRDAIYKQLDDPGQGSAARQLNRRWGSLNEVEREAYRRANVAKRQQPESLSEQIGAVRAAGDIARGTWRLLHGDVTGAADIAAGSAGRSTAKAIKESQTTDALIKRAFTNYTGVPTPVTMPPIPSHPVGQSSRPTPAWPTSAASGRSAWPSSAR